MEELEELYNNLRFLRMHGQPTQQIESRIKQLEQIWIDEEVRPRIEPVLADVNRKLTIVVRHTPGEPLKITLRKRITEGQEEHSTNETEEMTILPVTTNVSQDNTNVILSRRVENPTQGIRVTFPDGTQFAGKGSRVMVQTFRRIGFARVSSLRIMHSGYNLVDSNRRPPQPNTIWQHECDGWYVYTNTSNEVKMHDMKDVSNRLHVGLRIEYDS